MPLTVLVGLIDKSNLLIEEAEEVLGQVALSFTRSVIDLSRTRGRRRAEVDLVHLDDVLHAILREYGAKFSTSHAFRF